MVESLTPTAPADPSEIVTRTSQVNQRILGILIDQVPPEKIAARINELIDAKRQTKHGLDIDTRAVEVGVKLWLAYTVGLPTQRIETTNLEVNADNAVGLLDRLKHSPALRDLFKRIMAEAEGGESGPVIESVSE